MQTRFKDSSAVSDEIRLSFQTVIQDILTGLRKEIQDDIKLDELILQGRQIERIDTELLRSPENLTEELIIEKLLKFLGYSRLGKRSGSESNVERREADYTLVVRDERILVEAEPLNKPLFQVKGQGVEQVKSYLEKRSFHSDLGIATDGFDWVLIKYDEKSYLVRQVEHVSLKGFFAALRGQSMIDDAMDTLTKFYFTFSSENILSAADDFTRILEEAKENITSKFYEDYIRYVFGFDKKSKDQMRCLLNAVTAPQADEKSKRLFVITLMSRLIFIKFLEDKKLVKSNFLRSLLENHEKKDVPITFYRLYLQPLFYDVLNTPLASRRPHVIGRPDFDGVPYLNGGLFREVVPNEIMYDVDDDVIEKIIEMLQNYSFTLQDSPDTLNPDILGLVFEKTINYLTSEGTDRRKDLGAYYTPDDVTTYICRNTIRRRAIEIIREYLTNSGWRTSEVEQYTSLDTFLDDLPSKPGTVKVVYQKMLEITILDPACGSGHFLTSALKELYHINKILNSAIDSGLTNYELKKAIITHCLFGVDLESSAVEIARLRLWLGLIEDLDTNHDGEEIDTLPNIEYNIDEGNSLLGFTFAPTKQQMGIDDQTNLDDIFQRIDKLKEKYRADPDNLTAIALKRSIDASIHDYTDKLNAALAADLAARKGEINYSKQQISVLNPFHWRLKFSEVFSRKGGFDVIIGNPPYVERRLLNYPTNMLTTNNCRNTYAYFFEVALQLIKPKSYIGFIVPVSAVCTPRMKVLQQILVENCDLEISNFDDRPGKIFSGLEHCRSSIIIGRKRENKNAPSAVLTTRYIRWHSEQRSRLFNNLRFVNSADLVEPGIIPKLGTSLEINILSKLKQHPALIVNLVKKKPKEQISDTRTIWYHNAPQYWIRVMDFIPMFNSRGRTQSSHVKAIYLKDQSFRKVIIAILNSSLFYWYFTITSNGRDLNLKRIENFRIDPQSMSTAHKKQLAELCDELMKKFKEHSYVKTIESARTGQVQYQEFYQQPTKPITDEIDKVLAKHYGFTEDEKAFITSFDEGFRMGIEDLATEEDSEGAGEEEQEEDD